MELIFNPCGEFRRSTEGPVSQIHSPHLHVGAPGIFSDLLRSVQMLKREGCGKQREATAPIQSLVKLQFWFLSLWWKTCLRQNCSLASCACSEGPALGENTHDDDYFLLCSLLSPNVAFTPPRLTTQMPVGQMPVGQGSSTF